ncbi:MAG: hypothetical protein LBQ31_10400 [Bacteroidales bacterium]|nr:hypothetical protein [Bacteroidales bacterium]
MIIDNSQGGRAGGAGDAEIAGWRWVLGCERCWVRGRRGLWVNRIVGGSYGVCRACGGWRCGGLWGMGQCSWFASDNS